MNPVDFIEGKFPGLLDAVSSVETGGTPDPNAAVSPAGAIGKFQFMPATAKQYGIDPTDPAQARVGAAQFFVDLGQKYGWDLPKMLAGYNWGQGNVDRKGLDNAPPETQQYIQKVSAKMDDPAMAWLRANVPSQNAPATATAAPDNDPAMAWLRANVATQPSDPSAGGGTLQFGPFDTGFHTPQWLDRTLAGAGKAFVDTGRRVQQLVTLGGNQDAIDQSAKLDAPLMRTGAGVAGNVLGNISMMALPSAALSTVGTAAKIPALVNAAKAFMAPQSIPAGIASGALTAATTQPITSDSSTLGKAMEGGLAGLIMPAAMGAGSIVKGALGPFFRGGQETLAGNALGRFAANPDTILSAPLAEKFVPGSNPNLAEATGDPGLAQFVRTMRNNPDANIPLTQADQANRAARLGALQDIAGSPEDRAAWVQARQDVTQPLYDQAFSVTPTVTPWIKGVITQLQQRPAFNEALQQAQTLAQNEGLKLDPTNAVQVLHYTKMALDDMIGQASGNQQRGLVGTKKLVLSLLESKDFSPGYATARTEFSNMSQPINQIDVGQALLNKFQPGLADFGADTRTNAATFANALRNGDQLAAQATGYNGAKLADILGPQQMDTVTGIAKDLGRSAKAQDLGLARGSPTMQNFSANNLLQSLVGPVGLPQALTQKLINSALPQQILGYSKLLYGVPDKRVLGLLGEAAADPAVAAQLYGRTLRSRPVANLLPYATTPLTAGLLGLTQ